MSERIMCEKMVFRSDGSRFGRSRPCSRKGRIERDGKLYCRQHDPVAKAKRDTAAYAALVEEGRIRHNQRKLEHAAPALLRNLKLTLAWIDAVPPETILPAMPGIDREEVDALIARLEEEK